MRINANDEAIEILNTESVREDPIGGPGVNMTLRHENDVTNEKALLVKPSANNGFLTVTGTIKRGKKKEESCFCGLNRGIHILLVSLICVPFLWIFCTFYAFYMGTLTWYNVFIYYNEQRSCCHTVFVSPCVLLFLPILDLPSHFWTGYIWGIESNFLVL